MSSSSKLLELLRAAIAGGCASLVLALTVFAASPGLHHELHEGEETETHEDSCAITLFSEGVSLPLESADAPRPTEWRHIVPLAAAEEILLTPRRYLHMPERGPPAELS